MNDPDRQTAERLRFEIDQGRGRDKTATSAPLGAHDNVSGTPVTSGADFAQPRFDRGASGAGAALIVVCMFAVIGLMFFALRP